jgi:hypothetical protein
VKALLLTLLLAFPAFADDSITADGRMTDRAMLRLVTCGAPVGGDCKVAPVRWHKTDITISFGPTPQGYPNKRAKAINRALTAAIDQINATGSAIHLTRVTSNADIRLRATLFDEGDTLRGEKGVQNGLRMASGLFVIQPDFRGHIVRGTILIAQDIKPQAIKSVVLEEVTQSLGLRFDISDPAYEGVSIFAKKGNSVKTLKGQDAAILRLYYPG